MKVLVTGGGGYVGSTLVPLLLQEGFDVRVLDNQSRGDCDGLLPCAYHQGFEFCRGDVTNDGDISRAMRDVGAVVHLAALVGAPVCERNPVLAREVNEGGTSNVVKAAKARDVPVLFASTGSVYGKVKGVCTEDSPCNPLSDYGLTKLRAERTVTDYHYGYAFRFATAYGVSPKMRLDLLPNELAYRAVKEKVLVIYQADFRRTFIHVWDMANVFAFALKNLGRFDVMPTGVYNAGDPSGNCTKRELAQYVKSLTGCAIFYADSGYVDQDQRDYEVDYGQLLRTGWNPRLGMADGLKNLVQTAQLLQPRNQYVQNA